MKILHTADLHLGKSYKGENFLYSKQRREEVWQSFSDLISYANSNNIEIILISGDLYEREYFTLNNFKRLSDLFSISNSEIYIIGGNHDHVDENSMFLKVDMPSNVHLFTEEEYFEYKNLRIYGITWDRQYNFKSELNFELNDKFKNILMLHCSVGFESHFPISEEWLNRQKFDYIALGHFHGHKKVADRAYYSGALEPSRFKDEGRHGFYVYDLENENQEFVKFAKREYNTFKVDVTDKNVDKIKNEVLELLNEYRADFNKLILIGKNQDIEYILEILENNDFYYLKIVNETKDIINYEELSNSDTSGIISEVLKKLGSDEQAIKYGIEALLETANEN
ncbi:Ser/Thr protein phosphatase [Peptoniphilus indolicus ATCC 29427]|uniref:Ser/Thr protein phosphatase n=1 Tax=Peptoniphilus indolicus ATCC 29427 TaxID=997350 RepID=G4D0U8_9FIRM|nr:metallophosphoesterase [Peptoniphilus indolicus]EGY80844.1 Ser/Thr protein phosphatase [Peptoniphilus indolicus ATCC 29427]